MSAETFVFTQLQSGALPTELSEATSPTCLHYLTLINARGRKDPLRGNERQGVFKGRIQMSVHHAWSRSEGLEIGAFTAVARVAVKRGKTRLANGGVKGWDLQALQDQRWAGQPATMQRLRT